MTEQDDHPPEPRVSGHRSASVNWVRSALTSGLVSVVAVVPGVSVAAEPDTSQEGGSAPEHSEDFEADSPTYDPGGDTALPFETGSPSPSPDTGPVENEPVDDPEGRLAPIAEPPSEAPGSAEDLPVAPVEGVQPAPPPAPGFTIEPPPPTDATPDGPPGPPAAPQSLGAEPGSRPRPPERLWATVAVAPPATAAPPSGGLPSELNSDDAVARSETVASEAGSDDADASQGNRASSSDRGARVHVVRPGESLWSIAARLLGPDASAMAIAAEVARLWELNRDRISSGDPDLIGVGEHLRLR